MPAKRGPGAIKGQCRFPFLPAQNGSQNPGLSNAIATPRFGRSIGKHRQSIAPSRERWVPPKGHRLAFGDLSIHAEGEEQTADPNLLWINESLFH
jgi:hypothetical protein